MEEGVVVELTATRSSVGDGGHLRRLMSTESARSLMFDSGGVWVGYAEHYNSSGAPPPDAGPPEPLQGPAATAQAPTNGRSYRTAQTTESEASWPASWTHRSSCESTPSALEARAASERVRPPATCKSILKSACGRIPEGCTTEAAPRRATMVTFRAMSSTVEIQETSTEKSLELGEEFVDCRSRLVSEDRSRAASYETVVDGEEARAPACDDDAASRDRGRARTASGSASAYLERVWSDAYQDETVRWLELLSGEPRGERGVEEWLLDGVVLCKAANAIRPGVVPRVHRSQETFRHRDNAEGFLNACRSLGMRHVDLFRPGDLLEAQDLGAVLRCACLLGALATATVPSFEGPFLELPPEDAQEQGLIPRFIAPAGAPVSRSADAAPEA